VKRLDLPLAWVRIIAIDVSLYVCPLAYLKTRMSKFHEVFCACFLWLWLLGRQCNALLRFLLMTLCYHTIVHYGATRYYMLFNVRVVLASRL